MSGISFSEGLTVQSVAGVATAATLLRLSECSVLTKHQASFCLLALFEGKAEQQFGAELTNCLLLYLID